MALDTTANWDSRYWAFLRGLIDLPYVAEERKKTVKPIELAMKNLIIYYYAAEANIKIDRLLIDGDLHS